MFIKVKIFSSHDFQSLEETINKWLKENKDYITLVHNILQSQSENVTIRHPAHVIISIFYSSAK